MIFCNFVQGPRSLEPEIARDEGAKQLVLAGPGGAGDESRSTRGESTVDRLRRLMRVSSSKLMGSTNRSGSSLAKTASGTELAAMKSIETTTESEENKKKQSKTSSTTIVETKQVSATTGDSSSDEREKDWQLECKFTLNEVQQHSTLDDCWMVIFDKVYNVTSFVNDHPGGDFILLEYAGRDATHGFLSTRHGSTAYKMMDKYWIGILVDEELYYSNNSSYCSVYSNLSWRRSTDTTTSAATTTSTTTTTSAASTSQNSADSGQTSDEGSSSINETDSIIDETIELAELVESRLQIDDSILEQEVRQSTILIPNSHINQDQDDSVHQTQPMNKESSRGKSRHPKGRHTRNTSHRRSSNKARVRSKGTSRWPQSR